MISKLEYEVLEALHGEPILDESYYGEAIEQLLRDRLIIHNVTNSDSNYTYYDGYLLTQKGERAYEEYKSFLDDNWRKDSTVRLAEAANQISEKANLISEESNKIAKSAKRASIASVVISALSFLVAIASLLLTVLLR